MLYVFEGTAVSYQRNSMKIVLYNSSSSSIHLASSLTIETISKNNGGGGNYGGDGTIAIVDNEGTIIETIQEATPEDDSGSSEDVSEGEDY